MARTKPRLLILNNRTQINADIPDFFYFLNKFKFTANKIVKQLKLIF